MRVGASCECHGHGFTRRTVLRGAFGVALASAVGWPGVADAALPPGVTDVTGTLAAVPRAGDALFGLLNLAGDTHVHNDHSADGSFLRQTAGQGSPGNLSVSDQIGQAGRTLLDWMPLTDHRTYSQHWDPQWTSSSVLLLAGEEANGSPHAIVLGGVDEIVDGANPPGSADHRHVQQSVWETHAMGGVWGTAHPSYQGADAQRVNGNVVGIDWIETWNKAGDPDVDVDYAEQQWNAGFRTGISGACDDHFREVWGDAGPGMPCTSLLVGTRSQRGLLDALAAGRMVVSPLPVQGVATLEADLDGDGVFEALGGDEVRAVAGVEGTLRVRVVAGTGLTLIVWQAPGRSTVTPLVSMTVASPDQTVTVPVTVPAGAAWWRVELRGVGGPSGLQEVPTKAGSTAMPTPTSEYMGGTAPLFTYTVSPAVPAPASPFPSPLAASTADDVAAPLVLVGKGGFAGFPDLAVVGGVTHVVAERHVPGGTTVVHRLIPAGVETPLSTSTGARFPRVAAQGQDVWVVWSDDRGTQLPHAPNIYVRQSTDGGRTWLAEKALTAVAAGVRADHPSVLITPSGAPLVTWHENTGVSAFDVRAIILGVDAAPLSLAANGKTVTAPTAADTRSAVYPASLFPDVTTLPDGTLVACWQDDRSDPDPLFTGHTTGTGANAATTDPDSWEPLVSVRAPGASTWSAPRRVQPDPAQAQRHPAIAARADGLLVCVWEVKPTSSSSGSDVTLQWSSSTDAGLTWAVAADLDRPLHGMSQRPRLALDPDGGLRVVFYDSRAADWRWRVRTARLSDDGTAWTGAADVSTAGNSTFPAVSQGQVVWTTDRGAALQRDRTQQVALATLVPSDAPAPTLPEAPLAVLIPVLGAAAVLAVRKAHA